VDRQDRLADLLAEAHERQASGAPFDAEAFARAHPEFADEIRANLRVLPLAQLAMEGAEGSPDRVRAAIRGRLATDRVRGVAHDLAYYKNMFPGYWDVVGEEFRAAQSPPPAAAAGGGAPVTLATPFPSGRAPENPEVIGNYRIVREVGRGGMGVVYLAEDTRLRRNVALKILSPVFASSRDLQRRFEREAAIASKLDHPGICTVYEAGEAGGIPFIAMRFVHGETLEHWIAEARAAAGMGGGRERSATLPGGEGGAASASRPNTGPGMREEIRRIVHLVERAGRALHVAHEAGLIHRDVKPGNIMVTREGDPIVLDFGLARDEEGTGASITQTGALMGTPAYMSPEQIAAQRIRLDRRTDVYSLGVTLYEALTLRLPFAAGTRDSLYQKILVSEPENIRRLNPAVPGDLKVVVDKALEKDRDRRYQTALELAEDLRRVREDEPIRARPVSLLSRAKRWVHRNPGVAVPTLGLVALLVTLPPAALFLYEKGKRSVLDRSEQGWGREVERLKAIYGSSGNATVLLSLQEFERAVRLKEANFAKEAYDKARLVVDQTMEVPEAKDLSDTATRLAKEINREQRGE
jgi:hypothetical protein